MPTGKSTAVRMFGKTDALNVVSEEYGYNDKLIGLYIFAATDNTKSGEKPADKTDSSAAETRQQIAPHPMVRRRQRTAQARSKRLQLPLSAQAH